MQREGQWYEYLIEGKSVPATLLPNNEFERDAADLVLTRYAHNIASEDVTKRIIQFTNTYLEDYYRKRLRSRRRSVHINALHKIMDFQMKFLLNDVYQSLERKIKYTPEQYLLMYKVISLFDQKRFVHYLLHPNFRLGEHEYRYLLIELQTAQITTLLKRFNDLPQNFQYVFIDLLGVQHYLQHISFLEGLLDDEDVEIRVRSLKAIANIGYPSSVERYKPFVHSGNWVERLMAAKLLVHLSEEHTLELLTELLEDSSWEVRSQAASSLKETRDGIQRLKQFMSTSEDEYAKHMVKDVLGREALV
ncbi:HEAT repeat domain-containing protein [Bacillaceae bacterium SIJ1]|uniref:HEAT repeat domain-containing protein n=1 Tax=Litoribacterium kuwaitense TaxID=1398745 RepID=UPI0013E9E84C|nr:HEAT repeat domain-containing protein [Litoribacterium kuwaitense]NGP45352.1 HEAT repeat domain-containing protein [Litoribacterium kuwaitense]